MFGVAKEIEVKEQVKDIFELLEVVVEKYKVSRIARMVRRRGRC